MMIEGVETDDDAERFLDEVAEAMVSAFGVTLADAVERITKAAKNRTPRGGKLLPGPYAIVGDHLIYHKPPDYWAGAVYHGKRNFWKKP